MLPERGGICHHHGGGQEKGAVAHRGGRQRPVTQPVPKARISSGRMFSLRGMSSILETEARPPRARALSMKNWVMFPVITVVAGPIAG